MNQQLIPVQQAQSTFVARYGDDAEIKALVAQVKRAIPSASKCSDDEIKSLVIASKFSGLDPFAGEIYFIPSIGVMVATKVVVADAITAAAKRGHHIYIDFTPIYKDMDEGKQIGMQEGDVAWACVITDNEKRAQWYSEKTQLTKIYREMGYERDELRAMVEKEVGQRPAIVAIGLVKQAEQFGGERNEAKFSRIDRAKKRAVKKAINLAGYASTTEARRNFGGVPVLGDASEEEPHYGIRKPEPLSSDELLESVHSAITEQTTEERHEDNKKALGRVDDDDPDAPFGMSETPKATQSGTRTDAQKRIAEQAETAKGLVSKLSQANAENEARELDAELNAARGVYGKRASSIAELDRAADALQKANAEAQQALDKLAEPAETLPLI